MPVGEDQHVAGNATDLGDDVVGSAADIGRGLAAGTAIPPERPVRMDRLDFFRGETFVAAVIPFDQVRHHPGLLRIARQAAGLERALEWARQDERKCPGTKPRAECRGLPTPLLGQGKVGRTGVPATETPFRLAAPPLILIVQRMRSVSVITACRRAAPNSRSGEKPERSSIARVPLS